LEEPFDDEVEAIKKYMDAKKKGAVRPIPLREAEKRT